MVLVKATPPGGANGGITRQPVVRKLLCLQETVDGEDQTHDLSVARGEATIILAQCVPFTDTLDRVVGDCFGHGERSDWLGVPWLATVRLVGDGLTEGLESHVETTVGESGDRVVNGRDGILVGPPTRSGVVLAQDTGLLKNSTGQFHSVRQSKSDSKMG